jgi:hypothetical protein
MKMKCKVHFAIMWASHQDMYHLCNRLPCLMDIGHLAQNSDYYQVVWSVPTEALQSTWGVRAEEMTFPLLTANEQEAHY